MTFEYIKNIFLSYSCEDPLTDYVQCVDLAKYPATVAIWRTHTDRYVDLASRLSLCVHETGRLRYCSEKLYRAYRRLEEYSKAIGTIDTMGNVWKGHGKLLEITVYLYYVSHQRRSWTRHYELRMYIAVPLNLTNYSEVLTKDVIMHVVDDLLYVLSIRMDAPVLEYVVFETEERPFEREYAKALEELERGVRRSGIRRFVEREIRRSERERVKIGFREVMEIPYHREQYFPYVPNQSYPTDGRQYCNMIIRSTYDTAFFVLEDYRGYTYDPTHRDINMSREEVYEILKPLYDAVFDYYRYW